MTDALTTARQLCHTACQWPSLAARANLPAVADDSHSNLGWHIQHQALLSHSLGGNATGQRNETSLWRVGFCFADAALLWLRDEQIEDRLPLSTPDKGLDNTSAPAWLDRHLSLVGLDPTSSAELPYTLTAPDNGANFAGVSAATKALGDRYAQAQQVFNSIVTAHRDIAVQPPQIRCWPHHFDLAVLFSLEEGDPETARSIGLGLSPGDETYAEPYFYCSPWPAPQPASLPDPMAPWHWHTQGFTSLVYPYSAPLAQVELSTTVHDAFNSVRKLMA